MDQLAPLAAFSPQRGSAADRMLGHPLLYPVRLSDQPMERRGWRMAAPAHPRGSDIHCRLLARPAVDDASGMAPIDVVSHADLGPPRRANHRRSNDLFRHR